jgi:hypothetical protein
VAEALGTSRVHGISVFCFRPKRPDGWLLYFAGTDTYQAVKGTKTDERGQQKDGSKCKKNVRNSSLNRACEVQNGDDNSDQNTHDFVNASYV